MFGPNAVFAVNVSGGRSSHTLGQVRVILLSSRHPALHPFFSRAPLRARRGRAAVGRVRAATPISSPPPPGGLLLFLVYPPSFLFLPILVFWPWASWFGSQLIENVKRDCRRRAQFQSLLFSLWAGGWYSPSLRSSPSFFSPSSCFPNAARAPARNLHS